MWLGDTLSEFWYENQSFLWNLELSIADLQRSTCQEMISILRLPLIRYFHLYRMSLHAPVIIILRIACISNITVTDKLLLFLQFA